MVKIITIGTLVIGTMVYFGIYERLSLLYFEENKADVYAIYGAIPFLIYFSVALFIDKYKFSIKENRLIDALKYSLGGAAAIGMFCYFIMVPVISGAIIWTNEIFGSNKKILVIGTVVDKLEIDGAKFSEYELTVKTGETTITCDTNKIESSKFRIGDTFQYGNEKRYLGTLGKRQMKLLATREL